MVIAAIDATDLDDITSLQEEGWSDIRLAFTRYIEEPFSLPIKIAIDKQLAGVGAVIVHRDVAWLGHIIVQKEHRGKGLGKIITETLVNLANEQGCETIYLLATALGAPVYEKVGFVTETEYNIFTNIDLSTEATESGNILSYNENFKQEIVVLDKITSAEDRLFYLEKFLKDSYLYINKNKVEGYYIPTLENGPIIAKTQDAGLALVKLHLKTHKQLIFPKENDLLVDFLHDKGYTPTSSCKRMRFGKWKATKMAYIYNRIAGYLG